MTVPGAVYKVDAGSSGGGGGSASTPTTGDVPGTFTSTSSGTVVAANANRRLLILRCVSGAFSGRFGTGTAVAGDPIQLNAGDSMAIEITAALIGIMTSAGTLSYQEIES